jgi:penicillin-binding protein 1C
MVSALRSPGSALKPLIYALGFEKHLIHPQTLIIDRETRFGDYMPHNFSHRYNGEVTVAYALTHSLNIPAVKILERVGTEAFVERIGHVAGTLAIPKQRSTLPIALGGIGITMQQLAQLYVGLARGGESDPIRTQPFIARSQPLPPVCDAEAARMTTAILREIPAPEGFVDATSQIAYKTGTSYGYRDAWTIAYDKGYTVIVWVGKPSNAAQLGRTGRNTAAPLAFEVFALLDTLLPRPKWKWSPSLSHNAAPIGLQRFDPSEQRGEVKHLKMLYPLEGTRYRSADCSDVIVDVMVQDGVTPYYWYIDGEVRVFNRLPAVVTLGHGAHTITVIDSDGETIGRSIWVDKPEC